MTVMDAMKLTVDEMGNIVIPVGALVGEAPVTGTISEAGVRSLFGLLIDQEMPLTEVQFEEIRSHIAGQWGDNFDLYRERGVITVV